MGMNHRKAKTGFLALVAAFSIWLSIPAATVHADNRWIGILLNGALQWTAVQDQVSALDSRQGQPIVLSQFAQKTNYLRSPEHEQYLIKITNRLQNAANQIDPVGYPFAVYINPDKEFNAACTLAHVVTINAGAFELAKTEDEMAFLLAHEMAHGLKKHNTKYMNKQFAMQIARQLYLTYSNQSYTNYQLAGVATNFMMNQVFSVDHEWEADNLAFEYATRAGYNPLAGAALWTKVREKYGDNSRSFLGTLLSPADHPTTSQRIENYLTKISAYSHEKVEYREGNLYVNSNLLVDKNVSFNASQVASLYHMAGNMASAFRATGGSVISPATFESGAIRLNGVTILPLPGQMSEEKIEKLINLVNLYATPGVN